MKTSLKIRILLCAGVFADFAFYSAAQQSLEEIKTGIADFSGAVLSVSEYRGTSLDNLVLKSTITYKNSYPVLEKQYDSGNSLKSETSYVYRDAGVLSEIIGSDNSGNEIWKYSYNYDDRGRFIEEVSYGSNGSKEWQKVVTYGAHGYPIKEVTFGSDGTINMQETTAYNDNWQVSEHKTLYPDGKLLKRTVYTYNDDGRMVIENHYDITGLYERIQYTYTDDGRLKTATTVGSDGKVKSSTVRFYNASGKISEEDIFNADSSLRSKTEYAYDTHQNWIRKKDSDGQYIVRELTYGD